MHECSRFCYMLFSSLPRISIRHCLEAVCEVWFLLLRYWAGHILMTDINQWQIWELWQLLLVWTFKTLNFSHLGDEAMEEGTFPFQLSYFPSILSHWLRIHFPSDLNQGASVILKESSSPWQAKVRGTGC